MDEFFKDKDIEYKIFVANQVYPDSVSGLTEEYPRMLLLMLHKKMVMIISVFTT